MIIDPKVDLAFKYLLAREQSKPLLVQFLNAVLEHTGVSEIVTIELINPYNLQHSQDDKLSIVDIKARDGHGRLFEVEMQMLKEPAFAQRILYYWSKLYQDQLKASQGFDRLRPTIAICIANFVLFKKVNDYCLDFELYNRKRNIVFSSDIMVISLELPKFNIEPKRITNPLEAWLYFLREGYLHKSEELPEIFSTSGVDKAIEELEMLSKDDLERERYEARVKVLRDERSRVKGAEQKGLEKGIKKGIKEGKRELLMEQVEHKFGKIESELKIEINMLESKRLDELGLLLLAISNIEELKLWLRKA